MQHTWNFSSAGHLIFGSGAARRLGPELTQRSVRRVSIITDRTLMAAGVVEPILQSLADADIETYTFDGGQPEPSIELVETAAQQVGEFTPDAILGLGGGSNMDVAKMAAAIVTHGGSPRDYFGTEKVPGPVLTLVCVPTTAGTGSEVSGASVLSDTENEVKVAGLSRFLRPSLALVDPELTVTCPATVTADSGIDALTHAIEAYTCIDYREIHARIPAGEISPFNGNHPLGDCLAEKAIQLIGQHLVTAVKEPDNLPAREGMALAATIAGMAFATCGVALVHALEYPLGGALHVSHGAGNGLLLPYVMQFNLPTRLSRFAHIAQLLGVDTAGLTEQQAAEQAVNAVVRLKSNIGIPTGLRDIGATEEMLPTFAKKSFAIKRLLQTNPRDASEEDILSILQAAF